MNSKKNKLSSVNRLPSLYGQTLIKSEYEYQREIRRKLDRLDHDNHEAVRRRLANDYLFQHEHLNKRYQWFQLDKSYRESCRLMWNKESGQKPHRTTHVQLPPIYGSDEDVKQHFLQTNPVLLEVLHAPHSSRVLQKKHHLEMRKQSAQRRFEKIQNGAQEDQRYRELLFTLQET